ncbi:MAG TPA: UTP--glucose-1-phosphate uridylyltransferase [Marmoricola sp.]|nr:UTP--glucose-1-phosphate uridylyltransferase [Marmoricola sp.]
MTQTGLAAARAKMAAADIDPVAIDVFEYYYHQLEGGATGMIPEETIEPVEMANIAGVEVSEAVAADAICKTAVIKLNGGLGTSMGMEQAKSLLRVRDDHSFLDIMVHQILHLRGVYGARLPLILMNSFHTAADTHAALETYLDEGFAVEGLPIDFLQNREPRLLADSLDPVTWDANPDLEWCPPGHGDLYTALKGTGLLCKLRELGFERIFVSNSDNLGATPDARIAGWFAQSGAPFAIEAVRRTASDKKGGHFAKRLSDGRIVLRETAQTLPEDKAALADLSRHRYCSTNNLWFDLAAMEAMLDERHGVIGLPLIRNEKNVDNADPTSPKVIQIETAMGAAIEIFEGAKTIEVGRDRFIPVKTTSDLLVLRSDVYDLRDDYTLVQQSKTLPYVDLSDEYKLIKEFDHRFAAGVPSLIDAESLTVEGDWTFGGDVRVSGVVTLGTEGGHVASQSVLEG